ncbi:ATP-dependent zinc protease family protein [Xanthovirga aplysinae]|uniref:ATP-dependent zinc protease family protein n=1 Tax=Xanthovirga aplysinae TaxID=2529853 RepID=UPI0012BBE41A|nr:RimK/LysX family protein [Xanthovirga aplysinae]MTI32426.1 peptidase [Xanthovirga aplysinae]
MKGKNPVKKIIGRQEHIDLPELHLFQVAAKIDTGAFSSSLHCHQIELTHKNGKKTLHFRVLDPKHEDYNNRDFYFEDYTTKIIKSSTGEEENRFIIQTTVQIFNKKILTDFSLTNRQQMKFPILLGRKFLKHRFVVDVDKKNLSHKKI